jgi:hypothetical protein
MRIVAGYLAGSQDGKDGVQRIRTNLTAMPGIANLAHRR